jgi:fructose-bisphosphate aldolase class 1
MSEYIRRVRRMSEDLESVAATLVADGKGILAADESVATLTMRFDPLGIQSAKAGSDGHVLKSVRPYLPRGGQRHAILQDLWEGAYAREGRL